MPMPLVAMGGRLAASIALQEALGYGIGKAGDFAQEQGWNNAAGVLHDPFVQNVLPGMATGGFGLTRNALKSGGLGVLRSPEFLKGLGKNTLNEVGQGFMWDGILKQGLPLGVAGLGMIANQFNPSQSQPEAQPDLNWAAPQQQSFFNEAAFDPRYLEMYQIDPMQSVRDRYRPYESESYY